MASGSPWTCEKAPASPPGHTLFGDRRAASLLGPFALGGSLICHLWVCQGPGRCPNWLRRRVSLEGTPWFVPALVLEKSFSCRLGPAWCLHSARRVPDPKAQKRDLGRGLGAPGGNGVWRDPVPRPRSPSLERSGGYRQVRQDCCPGFYSLRFISCCLTGASTPADSASSNGHFPLPSTYGILPPGQGLSPLSAIPLSPPLSLSHLPSRNFDQPIFGPVPSRAFLS